MNRSRKIGTRRTKIKVNEKEADDRLDRLLLSLVDNG